MLNDVDLFSAEETYPILTVFQSIVTQRSTRVKQSVSLPFQRHLSRCVYTEYKISYPAAWNSVFGSGTNRTDNGRDDFLCLSRTDLTRFHFEFRQNGFETTCALGEGIVPQSFVVRAFRVIVQSNVEAVQRETAASLIKRKLRTALFWVITQRVAVIPYRRFGTTYLYHFKEYSDLDL